MRAKNVLVVMVETIMAPRLRAVMLDLAVRPKLKVKAVRVAVEMVAVRPRVALPEGVAILHPRLEISVPQIVWIIAPLNIAPCAMNTVQCKTK